MLLDDSEKQAVKQTHKQLQMFSVVFTVTCVALIFIPWFLFQDASDPFQFDFSDPLNLVLTLVAIVELAVASFVVRFFENISPQQDSSPGGHLITPHIVGLAFREVAAVLGFVLSYLNEDPGWVTVLGGLAVLSIVLAWPKREKVEKHFLDEKRKRQQSK